MSRLFHFLVILSSSLVLFGEGLPVWDFADAAAPDPWNHATRLTATATAEGLLLELAAWDSYLEANHLTLDPGECGGLSFEYRAEDFSGPTSGDRKSVV